MGFFTGSKPSIMTKSIKDPMKESVASPLSSFLSSRIGKGLDRYTGELTAPLDTSTLNRYNEYMSLNPSEFFTQNVTNPTMAKAREDLSENVTESYAGGLRGSGRYKGTEDYFADVTEDISTKMAKFVPSMYESQIKTGMSMQQLNDIKNQREYQDWYKSLPELNPALEQGLQFLSEGVGTGTTVFSALDPGQKGAFWDLLEIGGQVAAGAAMGFAMGGPAGAAVGGAAGASGIAPGAMGGLL